MSCDSATGVSRWTCGKRNPESSSNDKLWHPSSRSTLRAARESKALLQHYSSLTPCVSSYITLSQKQTNFTLYRNSDDIMSAWSSSWSSGQSFWLLITRSRVRFPDLPWEFFLEGEDPHGDHGLGSLVEFRFKAPPGTSYSYISIHLIGTT
jgi:hypothetical protein